MKYMIFVVLLFNVVGCGAEPDFNVSTLFGEWVVTGSLDSSGVSALSTKELKAMTGKEVILEKAKVKVGNKICEKPGYEVSVIAREELLREIHYADSKESGLPQLVRHIDAGCVDIFLKSENSILFLWGGDIFVATRK